MPISPEEPNQAGTDQRGRQGARWTQHRAARQSLILKAAVQLIDEGGVGAEVPIQRIAERAGVAKSVVYRQFTDREDLDRSIRAHIVETISTSLLVSLEISADTFQDALQRSVRTLIGLESDHPSLRGFLGAGPCGRAQPELDGISRLKATIALTGAHILAALAPEETTAQEFEPLSFAMVSMAESTVAHWARYRQPDISRDALATHLAGFLWHTIDGVFRARGITVNPPENPLPAPTELRASTVAQNTPG